MLQPILIDGVQYARPALAVVRGHDIIGLFPGEDGRPDSYDQWLCWGPASERNLNALRQAGVRIDREDRP